MKVFFKAKCFYESPKNESETFVNTFLECEAAAFHRAVEK